MNPCDWCGGSATVMKSVRLFLPACEPCARDPRTPTGPDASTPRRFRTLTITDLTALVNELKTELALRGQSRAPRETA